ncbi:hypothetical protein KP509_04G083800 [Ceratopteris richardii]|uniref:Dienelactone hydrolase domain-containing protein n=1 Tax=Ceratopteris richardii TaxID=49495 RepID=A0A8T2V6S1_CERRI|nr:hypothetical protein KP509_04G083800 [Ceratopteris richardii]
MAGPQCCTPGPGAEHCCIGKEENCGSLVAYITSHHTPTAGILLVNDIFGFEAPLLRKLADTLASYGYYVVVPDFFNKDPYVPPSTGDWSAGFGGWIKNHQALDSVEAAKGVVKCILDKGLPCVGAVGFCWGVVVQLAKGNELKAAVLAHPSFVTVEDIHDVKTPIAILAAEIDQTTPPALAEKFADVLKSKPEVESFVHIYPKVAHGWTCRYNPESPEEVANAAEAHNKMIEWFGKYLH